MFIAGYAQEVSSRRKDRQNRTHVDHSLTCCSDVHRHTKPKRETLNSMPRVYAARDATQQVSKVIWKGGVSPAHSHPWTRVDIPHNETRVKLPADELDPRPT